MNIDSSNFISSFGNDFDFEGLSLINGSIEESESREMETEEKASKIAENTIVTKHFVYLKEHTKYPQKRQILDFTSFSELGEEFNSSEHHIIKIQGKINNLREENKFADTLGVLNKEEKESKKSLLKMPLSELTNLEDVLLMAEEEILQDLIGKTLVLHEAVGDRRVVRQMEANFTVKIIDPEEYKKISAVALRALTILNQQYKLNSKETKEDKEPLAERHLTHNRGKEHNINVLSKFPPEVSSPNPKSTQKLMDQLAEAGLEADASRSRREKERKKHKEDREHYFEAKEKHQEEVKADNLQKERETKSQRKEDI